MPTEIAIDPYQERIGEVLALRKFKSDWDGMGAAAPNLELIAGAFEHLRSIQGYRPPESIGLTVNGGILLIWQTADEYLEAEITVLGRTEWMEMNRGSEARHWTELLQAPVSSASHD